MKNLKINIFIFVIVLFHLIPSFNVLATCQGDFVLVDKIPENYSSIRDFEKMNSPLIYFKLLFPYVMVEDTDGGLIEENLIPYNEDYLRLSTNREVYVNVDSIQNYLVEARKVYEEKIHIYQIGDIIKKPNRYIEYDGNVSIRGYHALNVGIDIK